jgi:stage II sporulation SpoAA-like protein
MPASVQHERANIYRLEVRGLLKKAEMEECERSLEEQFANERAVRLLVVLDRFEGWEPNASWNDLRFYASRGDDIERIAIVGEERWRELAMMFASADLRKAPVEFFDNRAAAEARAWLSQDG